MTSSADECFRDATWKACKSGFQKIFSNDISKPEYLRLYTTVYNMCIGALSNNGWVYEKLKETFQVYLEDLLITYADLSNEPLLQCYVKQWQDYRFSSKVLDGIFSKFNSCWVRRERGYNHVEILEVYPLALACWRDFLLEFVKRRISTTLLALIENERNGEIINSRIISTILNSFIEISMNCPNPNSNYLYLYKDEFETDFLLDTDLFYSCKSASFIRENSVTEFMKMIEIWLQEERKRCQLYLYESTMAALLTVLEKVLIVNYIENFCSELKILLTSNKLDDLKRVFKIFSNVNSLDKLKIQFEYCICQQGLKAVENCNQSDRVDPEAYVSAILDVYRRNNAIVITAFESKTGFPDALDKACVDFINSNSVTESSGSSGKSAELLAKYCDLLLKRKPRHAEENEIVDNLSLAMIIFKYIEDKDVFQRFYSTLLGYRLINQTSTSGNNDVESVMLSMMREVCDIEYTSRLQRMFQDVCVSRDLSDKFRGTSEKLDVDFNINIISSSSWPFHQTLACILPQELEQAVQLFAVFYYSHFNGRKLTWLYGLSKGELVSKCFSKSYTFQASLFQMAVLLQFNTGDTFTVFQLGECTGIKFDILQKVLKTLKKFKLLELEDETTLSSSSTVSLFLGYQNKKVKIDINVPVRNQTKSEDIVNRHVQESRKLLIQAAIVRIAKSRKVINHHLLLSEVLGQMAKRFKPKIPVIKKCIDVLIEKEYLKREEQDSYSYIS